MLGEGSWFHVEQTGGAHVSRGTANSELRAEFFLIVPCGTLLTSVSETQSATRTRLQIRAAQQSLVSNQQNFRSYTSSTDFHRST
jgi:hypothetical protein